MFEGVLDVILDLPPGPFDVSTDLSYGPYGVASCRGSTGQVGVKAQETVKVFETVARRLPGVLLVDIPWKEFPW